MADLARSEAASAILGHAPRLAVASMNNMTHDDARQAAELARLLCGYGNASRVEAGFANQPTSPGIGSEHLPNLMQAFAMA
jgi:hypothetical protein